MTGILILDILLTLGLLAGVALAISSLYTLLSLPIRRQERTRFFLDLLEDGLRRNRTPEQAIADVAASRDPELGVRFHMLAAHLALGRRLGDALQQVPRFLPPRVQAMLRAGETIGDVRRVIPACRTQVEDGLSAARSALNYVLLFKLLAAPATPALLLALCTFVFPRIVLIAQDIDVRLPAFTIWVIQQSTNLWLGFTVVTLLFYLALALYFGGPRLTQLLQSNAFPFTDALAYRIPWKRRRIQRDFVSLLAALLDHGVPEADAVRLASDAMANRSFLKHARRVLEALARGERLEVALQHLDASGELRWRVANAARSRDGFATNLRGWIEALDAKAFQLEQAAAQLTSTGLVLANGVVVFAIVVSVFLVLIAVTESAML
jgi:type II secretory pathway component PulF